ncbi:LysR family transcriptional regulator [Psychrobacter sp. FDAARGOS_221]|uniref:LysR family transcriptional regulator n=1 Tax=Psychrobacter sp. FDAARGOS_221 TaxID=1975705 RepID=UPI000BB5334A|nr:LysR family transcriptional regulator [Psychrobacter sp. FDAARGOS_221]PNK60904.1 LysR family transcriptional regulator [Psychrobacter sp. FDAARGOS_221]
MEIDALRCFIAVVETGSYSQAAKQVHRSQSAVSQKMGKLAEQTGKVLFTPVGRSLELTEEGKFLLSYARHIITLHDDAMRQMSMSKQIIRPLRLGCPDDYAGNVLPKVIDLIRRCVPNLPIHVTCNNSTNLQQMLANGDIDTAIVSRSSTREAGQYLEKSEGVWAFNGDIEGLRSLYKVTRGVPLVLFEQSCAFHHAAVQGLSQLNINSHIVCSTNSVGAIKGLVMAGQGVTVVADSSLGEMTVLNNENNPLPFKLSKLPSVIIEMVIAANAHPNFGRAQLNEICSKY